MKSEWSNWDSIGEVFEYRQLSKSTANQMLSYFYYFDIIFLFIIFILLNFLKFPARFCFIMENMSIDKNNNFLKITHTTFKD